MIEVNDLERQSLLENVPQVSLFLRQINWCLACGVESKEVLHDTAFESEIREGKKNPVADAV